MYFLTPTIRFPFYNLYHNNFVLLAIYTAGKTTSSMAYNELILITSCLTQLFLQKWKQIFWICVLCCLTPYNFRGGQVSFMYFPPTLVVLISQPDPEKCFIFCFTPNSNRPNLSCLLTGGEGCQIFTVMPNYNSHISCRGEETICEKKMISLIS